MKKKQGLTYSKHNNTNIMAISRKPTTMAIFFFEKQKKRNKKIKRKRNKRKLKKQNGEEYICPKLV